MNYELPLAHTFSCIVFVILQSCLCQYVKDRSRMKNRNIRNLRNIRNRMVENNGFEPLTPCLQSRCSSQLS